MSGPTIILSPMGTREYNPVSGNVRLTLVPGDAVALAHALLRAADLAPNLQPNRVMRTTVRFAHPGCQPTDTDIDVRRE